MIFGEAGSDGEFSDEEADVVIGGSEEDYGFHVADVCVYFFLEGEGMDSPTAVIVVVASVLIVESIAGIVVEMLFQIRIAAWIIETTDKVDFTR